MREETETTTLDQPYDAARASRLIVEIRGQLEQLEKLVSPYVPAAPHPGVIPGMNLATPDGFLPTRQSAPLEGIDGTFDGERMITLDGKAYPVPPNYASKSKLVEGDPLRMYHTPDGRTLFKQVGPISRDTKNGRLLADGANYLIEGEDGTTYRVLTASVTYHMSLYGLQVGGEVTFLVPTGKQPVWAVIDSVR